MNKEICVWDPLLRIFHWSLVVSFSIGYLTGEDESSLHVYSGYAVLGLIIFRLLWGIVGSKHARFSDFVYSPKEVIQYFKDLLNRTPKHYLGHNPLGGWMVIALLLSLFIVTISGLKLYAIEEGKGPLANSEAFSIINVAIADDDEDDWEKEESETDSKNKDLEDFWEEVHEISANFTLLLIFMHIMGVIVSSRLHKENLVKAMITGKKSAPPES